MNILVCVKQVKGEINPFDASAVEAALRIRDAEVTVLSMGRAAVAGMLQKLIRLGVKRAVLLSDNAFAGADTLATAYALSMAVKRLSPDFILCGRQSVDGDTAQTGPMLAALLDWPVLTNVMELSLGGSRARCVTRLGEESASLPCVLTLERIYSLRFPRIGSRQGAVEVWSAADIGADVSRCGLRGSPTRVLKTYECTAGRRSCRFIEPDMLDAAIVEALAKPRGLTDAAAEGKSSEGVRLPEIWCVGDGPAAMARTIAETVHILPPGAPPEMAAAIKAGDPAVVLWPADVWGRRTAPQVAALLQTGLCADCTALETDGDTLFMLRPAGGGSIMARIRCLTRPVMATVRTADGDAPDVIVTIGAGAAARLDEIKAWADSRGYALAASRALVDKGLAPYEWQVGLTGKTVAPRVYVAIGVSGAVQHTCAIEGAGTVIAVNTDRKARIFDYADIGITGDFPCALSSA